jgi:hypothetical protein
VETDQLPAGVNTGEAREAPEMAEGDGRLTLSRLAALRSQLNSLAARGLLAQVKPPHRTRAQGWSSRCLSASGVELPRADCAGAGAGRIECAADGAVGSQRAPGHRREPGGRRPQ